MNLFGRKIRRDNASLLKLIEVAQDICALKDSKIQALKLENARLEGELSILKEIRVTSESVQTPTISSQPLYLNEQEEDIQYAYRNELIDKDTMEDMLRQLEFDNAEISIEY